MRILVLLLALGVSLVACSQPLPQTPSPRPTVDFDAPRVIYYLAPPDNVRGLLNDAAALANGWTQATSWSQLRSDALTKHPEGIVVDATQLEAMSDDDRKWLRAQFDDGVVVASVAANFDQLARAINTPTLLHENEQPLRDPTQLYLVVYEYLSGTPEDIARSARQYPDASKTRTPGIVTGKTQGGSGRSQGSLDNPQEFQVLFWQLNMTIDSVRQQRAEFNARGEFEPLYEITTDKPETFVSYSIVNGVTYFDVFGPNGIGSAHIVRTRGEMPKQITLRFFLKGLESLKFSYDNTQIQVSVSSSGDHAVIESMHQGTSTEEIPLNSTSEFWMPTEIVSQNKTIPLQDGYFQVELPRAFFESGAREFEIEWIDFYR